MAGLLRTLALLWLLRQAYRLLRTLLIAAILAALWPVTLAAAAAAAAAWALGWPPARLYRAAARSTPVLAVYAVAAALRSRAWRALAARRRCGTGSRPPACWRTAGSCPPSC